MKGTIIKAAEKMITSSYGIEKWEEILKKAGFECDHVFLIRDDVPDNKTMQLLGAAMEILNFSKEELFKEYAKYWIHHYTQDVYPSFKFNTAKEFIENIPTIHNYMTESVPNATPPGFEFNWLNDNELELTYISKRGMIDLAKHILFEIGVKYNTKISITKIDETKLKLIFS